VDPAAARIVRVSNTLHVEDAMVSEAIARELTGRSDITVRGAPEPFRFEPDGRLSPMGSA
jgi:hypothetical protein